MLAFGGVGARGIGELLSWLIAAGVLAGVLAVPAIAARRQKQSRADPLSNLLLVSFAALVFFGVCLDVLHGVADKSLVGRLIGAIEDGGEMLSIAFACSCAFVFFRRTRQDSVPTLNQ